MKTMTDSLVKEVVLAFSCDYVYCVVAEHSGYVVGEYARGVYTTLALMSPVFVIKVKLVVVYLYILNFAVANRPTPFVTFSVAAIANSRTNNACQNRRVQSSNGFW